MDNDFNTENDDINFGKEIAKTFVQSTAVSAGTLVGMIAVGYAINKIVEFKEKKAQAKFDAAFNEIVIDFTHRPQS